MTDKQGKYAVGPLLREQEVADILNFKVATLRRWRWAGKGPRYRKIGGAVRYSVEDLKAFIEASVRSCTAEVADEDATGPLER